MPCDIIPSLELFGVGWGDCEVREAGEDARVDDGVWGLGEFNTLLSGSPAFCCFFFLFNILLCAPHSFVLDFFVISVVHWTPFSTWEQNETEGSSWLTDGNLVICLEPGPILDSDDGKGIFLGSACFPVSFELAFLDRGLFLGLLVVVVRVAVWAGLGKVAFVGLGTVGLWFGRGLSLFGLWKCIRSVEE